MCRGCAYPVDTIVGGRDANGAGWRGGFFKLAANLHEDVARTIESPPLLRSEGLPVGSPEPTPQTSVKTFIRVNG